MPAVDDLGASKQIEDSVEHNPDAIDEMPVELSCFKAEMVAGADASTRAGLQSNDGDTDHPKSDVQAVKASEGVEGAGKKVVGEAEGQVEILNHLTRQENRTQAAVAAAAVHAAAAAGASTVISKPFAVSSTA